MPGLSFIKAESVVPAAHLLVDKINEALSANKSVLWLLSGGSSIDIAVAAAPKLTGVNLTKLTISLIDERYGPIGHHDSNWIQLEEAGFMLPGAMAVPILDGSGFEETVRTYNAFLAKALDKSDYRIAIMGIGPDNHIAGIKPHSPAVSAESLAIGYDWQDYKGRISMTFSAIRRLDCTISYLNSLTKRQAIDGLQKKLPLSDCPSQILKEVKEAIIFNDLVGEEEE